MFESQLCVSKNTPTSYCKLRYSKGVPSKLKIRENVVARLFLSFSWMPWRLVIARSHEISHVMYVVNTSYIQLRHGTSATFNFIRSSKSCLNIHLVLILGILRVCFLQVSVVWALFIHKGSLHAVVVYKKASRWYCINNIVGV